MTKLIVEMEMPKGCTWTDENENGHHCPLLDIDCDCVLQEKGRKIGWDEQYANCPIVGLLPDEHGRLIDADAYQYYGDLVDEPTIVPSTRKEKQ